MKKYDSYKDSGIEWIGEIPNHWILGKIKFSDTVIMGQSPLSDDCNSEGNGLPFLQGNAEFGKLNPTPKLYCEIPNKIADINDVLLSVRAPVGALNIANQKFGIGRGLCAIRHQKSNYKYIYYWLLHSNKELDSISTGSTFKAISLDDVKNINFPSMDIYEQTTIANYLDHKSNQIDHLIAKKEQFIQLLEEERVAVINQAVTKGLDTNIAMKDSGIEWLGKIPEHWEEARIKNIVKIIGRIGFRGYTTEDLVQKGEGAISLSPSNIKNHILNIDDCTYLSWEKYNESPEIKIFENDIILVKTGSTIGKTAIIPIGTPEMTLNPQLVVFKDIKLNPVFLYYMMISNYFQGYFSIYTAGGSTPAISQEKINNFKITFPKTEEQIQISNFITKKELEIKLLISKAKQEIMLLKEYKTALISEVVTGKVDVRNEKLN